MRIAAGVAIVIAIGASAWVVGSSSTRRQLRETQASLQAQLQTAQNLEAENRNLRGAVPSPGAIPPPAQPAAPQPAATAATAALERELGRANADAAAASQALTDERARVGDLQRDLAASAAQLAAAQASLLTAQTNLAAAQASRDEAGRNYQQAVQAAAQDRRSSEQRETELAGFRNRVRDLEAQITQYRQTIDSQQRQLQQHFQMTAMLESPSVFMIRLRATEAGASASGVALLADGSRLVFYASNLPALPAGRVYQLWMLRGRSPAIASAGTFARAIQDAPTIQFANAQLIPGVTALAVTDEPAGGSPLPTGHKVLIGTPRG
jgi:hypothetical protein